MLRGAEPTLLPFSVPGSGPRLCGEGVAARGFTLEVWSKILFLLNLLVHKTWSGRALGSGAGWGRALCSREVLLVTVVLLRSNLGLCGRVQLG